MNYDDWKATEPPQEEPYGCNDCGHIEGYCDCPCCTEPPREGMREHEWAGGVCTVCRRHREDEGIRGCNGPTPAPAPAPEESR